MTPSERIDYLIKMLAADNAKAFAEKCGIRPDSLSKARKGAPHYGPSRYYGRIVEAYGEVNPQWLMTGEGEPLRQEQEADGVLARLDALTDRLDCLISAMEKLLEKKD